MTELSRYASHPWTQVDDLKLRKLALAGASTRAIARQLGRTISAITSRARKLNISLGKAAQPQKRN
jgi:hypothetical protein